MLTAKSHLYIFEPIQYLFKMYQDWNFISQDRYRKWIKQWFENEN